MTSPSIVWFRDDLRLADHPALRAALDRDEPVIGLYVLDDESPGIRPLGGAARWWLHHSLTSLAERLRERGMLTGEEVARQLGVSPSTVHQLGRQGLLTRHLYGNNHRCLYEPPGNVKLVKGAGSRYGGRPPRLTVAQPAGQGAS